MRMRLAFLAVMLAAGCDTTGADATGVGSGVGVGAGSGPAASSGNGAGVGGATTGTASSGAAGVGGAASGTSSGGPAGSTGASSSSGAPSGSTGASSSSGAGGAPSSGSGAGGGIYNTPPTCTSMMTAPGGNTAYMKPGEACGSCHVLFGAATSKIFDVGGTVYPTAHEPNDCNGVNVTGATVVITDANGTDTPLPVNSAGNFYHEDAFGFAAFKTPLKARVEYNGQIRRMLTPLMTGDCNSCHTEAGTQSAPGRIMLP